MVLGRLWLGTWTLRGVDVQGNEGMNLELLRAWGPWPSSSGTGSNTPEGPHTSLLRNQLPNPIIDTAFEA